MDGDYRISVFARTRSDWEMREYTNLEASFVRKYVLVTWRYINCMRNTNLGKVVWFLAGYPSLVGSLVLLVLLFCC